MKRALFLIISIVLLAGLILAGCAKSTPSPSAAPAPASSAAPAPSTAPAPSAAPAPPSSAAPAPASSAAPAPPKSSATSPTVPSTPLSAEQPKRGGNFKMIGIGGITAWDAPTISPSFLDMRVANLVYDRILGYDMSGKWTPRLATNYVTSTDGKTVTLTLRKGVMFQDGTEMTSKDVKYHIENFAEFGAKMGVAGGFKYVTSVDTPDPYTVVLNLRQPDASLPLQLALMNGVLNSSAAAQKEVAAGGNQASIGVSGAGPFKYVDWKRDVNFRTTRFDNYWDAGKPYLDSFELDFFADRVSATLAFQNGEAQGYYDVTPKDAKILRDKGFQIVSAPWCNFVLVPDGANADSPFADLRVRQAVEYALDKKTIADTFGLGYYKVLDQIAAPDATLAYNPSLQPRTYDPAKAKQLLAAAGYPNGIQISMYAQMSDNKELLTAIQGYLAAVGINAKIEVGDPAKFHGDWSAKGWHNGLIFRPYGFQPNFFENLTNWWRHPPAGSMFTSVYYPPNWDSLCDAAVSEPDPAKAKAMVQDIVKILFDNEMAIPICTNPQIFAFAKNVGGIDTFVPIMPHTFTPSGLWLR
jgi:peptide/nickel transport system substrate-binding protein